MEPGASYAVVTFASGVLLLMGWFYATLENPRSGAMFKKSLLLFLLPMLFWPGRLVLHLPLGILLAAACEEGLKAFASTRERSRVDKFWLVALFGIWELAVDKPFWGLVLAQSGGTWDRLSILGLVYATALPVLMHAVTAAIYASSFERRPWAAFSASWIIHVMFNQSVEYFGLSPASAIIQTAILGAILTALLLSWRHQLASESR